MWYRALRMPHNINQWWETRRSQSHGSKDGRAVSAKTAQKLNISQGSVYSVVYDSLVFHKDCARWCPGNWQKGTAHTTIILQKVNCEYLDQLAYCPDLAPSHFYLLWTPKKRLHEFADDNEEQEVVHNWLGTQKPLILMPLKILYNDGQSIQKSKETMLRNIAFVM